MGARSNHSLEWGKREREQAGNMVDIPKVGISGTKSDDGHCGASINL